MVTSHAPPTVTVHQDASEGIDGEGNNPGETSEAAKQGRSFDVNVSPRETWDAVFETVMGELRAEGHENPLVNLKKKVILKSVSISISYDRVLVAVLCVCVKFGQNSTSLTPGKGVPHVPWHPTVANEGWSPPFSSCCRRPSKVDTSTVKSFANVRDNLGSESRKLRAARPGTDHRRR